MRQICFLLLAAAVLSGCRRGENLNRDYPPPFQPPSRTMGPSGYSVQWERHYFPNRVRRSSTTIALVELKNTSDQVWPTIVKLVYSWSPDPPGAVRTHGTNRTLFRRPVAPGQEVLLDRLEVVAPDRPGRYLLTFELVHELVTWFSDRGGKVLTVPVTVD